MLGVLRSRNFVFCANLATNFVHFKISIYFLIKTTKQMNMLQQFYDRTYLQFVLCKIWCSSVIQIRSYSRIKNVSCIAVYVSLISVIKFISCDFTLRTTASKFNEGIKIFIKDISTK